jgi:hypothetical protein
MTNGARAILGITLAALAALATLLEAPSTAHAETKTAPFVVTLQIQTRCSVEVNSDATIDDTCSKASAPRIVVTTENGQKIVVVDF